MKRIILLLAALIWISALQAKDSGSLQAARSRVEDTALQHSDNWSNTLLTAPALTPANYKLAPIRTDKGLFGGKAGKGRMYCDILLPALTPQLLIDVGMSMIRMPGVIGAAPRWFAMFSPIACSQDELFSAAKCQSTIMVTMRAYF